MKTIKIIDLLNLVYENKAPKKIKYDGEIFFYSNCRYKTEDGWLTLLGDKNIFYSNVLNYEVEIIEDKPKKIDEEQYFYNYAEYDKNQHELDKVLYIIRALNRLEKKCSDNAKALNYLLEKSDK